MVEAIEQKYYEDTGISLDFNVAFLGMNMKDRLTASLAGGDQVDMAISHSRTGTGIDDYAISNSCYYDLADLIDSYGDNIYDNSDLDIMTTVNQEIIAFPSYVNPYKYGILVRKDYMEATGYTDNANDAAEKGLKLLSCVEDFEDMCIKMRSKDVTGLDKDSAYSLSGAIWDVEKVFAGAFSNAGYWNYTEVLNDKGEIVKVLPGYATPAYEKLAKLEYDWVNKGIISKESFVYNLSQLEGSFISGQTGVMVGDPTIDHLIEVARKTKANIPEAEFTVIGPLAMKDTPDQKGFIRPTAGYMAGVVMKTSKNAKDIVQFVDWMYSDEDNYSLCRLGIEGEHWINNGDGTYSYPAGKEEYLLNAPYSGALSIVENQMISNLVYNGYTEEEKTWINLAQNKANYVVNDTVDFIMPVTEALGTSHTDALNNFYTGVAKNVWTGETNPLSIMDGKTRVALYQELYLQQDKDYLEYLVSKYKLMKQSRI